MASGIVPTEVSRFLLMQTDLAPLLLKYFRQIHAISSLLNFFKNLKGIYPENINISTRYLGMFQEYVKFKNFLILPCLQTAF